MYIFIYGTLKHGFCGHNFLVPHLANDHLKRINPSFSISGFKLKVGIAPFLIRSANSEDIVKGELYDFYDEKLIAELDKGEAWAYERLIVAEIDNKQVYAYVCTSLAFMTSGNSAGSIYTKEMDDRVNSISNMESLINPNTKNLLTDSSSDITVVHNLTTSISFICNKLQKTGQLEMFASPRIIRWYKGKNYSLSQMPLIKQINRFIHDLYFLCGSVIFTGCVNEYFEQPVIDWYNWYQEKYKEYIDNIISYRLDVDRDLYSSINSEEVISYIANDLIIDAEEMHPVCSLHKTWFFERVKIAIQAQRKS